MTQIKWIACAAIFLAGNFAMAENFSATPGDSQGGLRGREGAGGSNSVSRDTEDSADSKQLKSRRHNRFSGAGSAARTTTTSAGTSTNGVNEKEDAVSDNSTTLDTASSANGGASFGSAP